MNNVYLRLVLYALSVPLSMIPLAWGSWISYNPETDVLQITVGAAVTAGFMALSATGGIFAIWGKK